MQDKTLFHQMKAKIYKYSDYTGGGFLTAKPHTILCFTKVIQCFLLLYKRDTNVLGLSFCYREGFTINSIASLFFFCA